MEFFDYLIVGGGIAGTVAAETIRQKDPFGSIALIGGEPHFLYSRVLLPEYIRGEVGLEKVMLRAAEDYKKNGIEIFLDESAEVLDPERMILRTDKSREFQAKKILIASGGKPKPWQPIGQHGALTSFRLQTLDDANKLKDFLLKNPSGKALIIGGGFMALEFIEILNHFGWKITLLCKEERFWSDFLDEKGSEILADLWKNNGIETIFDDEITNLRDSIPQFTTRGGKSLETDIVCVGIGLERNLDYFCGYQVSAKLADTWYPQSGKGIKVSEYLETELPNVWAAGDVALYPDPFSGRMRPGGNWSGAFMQGRVAGNNLAGTEKEKYKNLSTYAISHLGLGVAFTGDVGPFGENTDIEKRAIHYDKDKNEYIRVFLKDGRVVGAALINGQRFLGKASQVIMNKWDDSKIISG